jgi:hypothetical protein
MKVQTGVAFFLSSIALAACGSLSRAHAEKAQAQLSCGLTVPEVEKIVAGSLQLLDVPVSGSTHLYRDGSTDLRFIFDQGGLQSSQLVQVVGFKEARAEPRIEHCPRTSP